MDCAIDSDDRANQADRPRSRPLVFFFAGVLALALAGAGSWLWGQRIGTTRAVADAQDRSEALSARILNAGVVVGVRTEDPAVRNSLDQLLSNPGEDVLGVRLRTIDGRTVYSGPGGADGADDPLDAPGLQALQSRSSRTEVRRSADPRDTLLRVHQPVQPDDGEALLLQTDYDYTALTAEGRESWRLFAPVTLGAMVAMALLWLCLAGLASVRTTRGSAGRRPRENAWMDFIDQPQGWSEPSPVRRSAPQPAPAPELSEWAELAAQHASARPVSQQAPWDSAPLRLLEPASDCGFQPAADGAATGGPDLSSGIGPDLSSDLGPDLGSWADPARELITRALSPAPEPAAPEPVPVLRSSEHPAEEKMAEHGAQVVFDADDELGWLETVTGGTPWPAVPFSQPVPDEALMLPGAFRDGARARAATQFFDVIDASGPSTSENRPTGVPQPPLQPLNAAAVSGRPERAETQRDALRQPQGGQPHGRSPAPAGKGAERRPANGRRRVSTPSADSGPVSRRRSLETTLTGMLVPLARHGIDARLDLPPGLELPDDTEELLIRAAEEALHNSVSYADAHTVKIRLDVREERVALTVDDDGRGFDPTGGQDGGHTGLETLTRLAADAGGALHVRSTPNRGTRLHLDLPAALAS